MPHRTDGRRRRLALGSLSLLCVKNEMSQRRAAAIANSEGSSIRGGKKSRSGSSSKSNASQGGTTQQKKADGRKGGKATANLS